MDAHTKLLEVTARLFSESGYRGTTTRRIAREACVNEVTIFRHFGSKDALIKAALHMLERRDVPRLPDVPGDAAAELTTWVRDCHERIYDLRSLIRRVIGEMVEHPEIAPSPCEDADREMLCLAQYLGRLRELGRTTLPFEPMAVSSLLLGALFTDALWRDLVPEMPPAERVLSAYVQLVLNAIGYRP
jgi:AcrR family transcriptional regulator